MQSLPRPPEPLSLPPRRMIRSALLDPVILSALFVPTTAKRGVAFGLRAHGLLAAAPVSLVSGITVPPRGTSPGRPTTMTDVVVPPFPSPLPLPAPLRTSIRQRLREGS